MEQRCSDTDRGKPKDSEKNLSQCRSHTEWPGLKPGPQRWDAGTNRLSYGTAMAARYSENSKCFHVTNGFRITVTLSEKRLQVLEHHCTRRVRYYVHRSWSNVESLQDIQSNETRVSLLLKWFSENVFQQCFQACQRSWDTRIKSESECWEDDHSH
jgi:hypothetical protein